MATGASPMPEDIKDYMQAVFSIPLMEAYSQTEATGVSISSRDANSSGHVGVIHSQAEFKLVSIPEMGYTVNDLDEEGNPSPRGEIYHRSAGVTSGYYKDEATTNEVIDKDGWLHTNDIAQLLPNKGNAVKIIDRKGNFFKLSNGKWICPDNLEQYYKSAKSVKDFWIYGKQNYDYLVAVVTVHSEEFVELMNENGIQGRSFEEFVGREDCDDVLLKEIQKSVVGKLPDYMVIKRIFVSGKSFKELDLYTFNGKMMRRDLKKYFDRQVEEMFE